MEEAAKEAKLRRDETADDERAEKERARTHVDASEHDVAVDASEHDVKAVPAASDPSEKALQKQQAKKKSSQKALHRDFL
jgi:hypothetical protein